MRQALASLIDDVSVENRTSPTALAHSAGRFAVRWRALTTGMAAAEPAVPAPTVTGIVRL
jgi:hypothetical protein